MSTHVAGSDGVPPLHGAPAAALRVSCVVTAYNYGEYIARAIESILAQDYPSELVEIIVVDDGSTDDTAEIVAGYAAHVRYLAKENGGLNSAYAAGLAAASGEAIAFLDADDEWPADKLSRQLGLLAERPEVGLVYGDLEVIGPQGEHLHPSYLRAHRIRPRRGAILGTLIHDNIVTGGSAVVRASVCRHALPLPAWVAFPDWWVAVCAAAVSDVDYVPASVYRYRLHGANMGFGVDPRVRLVGPVRERELPFRRELLVRLTPGSVPVRELVTAYGRFRGDWNAVAVALGEDVRTLITVEPDRRERAALAREQSYALLRDGWLDEAAARAVAALADDPWDPEATALLESILSITVAAARPPASVFDARTTVAGLRASEFERTPELLDAFAERFTADDDVTLVVHGDRETLARVERTLQSAAARYGAALPDVIAVTCAPTAAGEQGLAQRLDAALGEEPRRGALRTLPQLDGDSIGELPALAQRRAAQRVLVAVSELETDADAAIALATTLAGRGCEVAFVSERRDERRALTLAEFELLELRAGHEASELEAMFAEGEHATLIGLGRAGTWPVSATLAEAARRGRTGSVGDLADLTGDRNGDDRVLALAGEALPAALSHA